MSAYNDMDTAVLGLKYGIDSDVETMRAVAAVNFGAPVFAYAGNDVNAYNAAMGDMTIALDGDLVASNVYTITINGTATAVTYATSHLNTMNLMKAALEAAFSGMTVTVGGASNRTLTIQQKGANFDTVTAVVTLGAGQAAATITKSTAEIFHGVALYVNKSTVDATGGYIADESINVLSKGFVWVYASGAVNAGEKAYVIYQTSATRGQFTNSSSSTYPVNGYFRSNTSGAGLVLVELFGIYDGI